MYEELTEKQQASILAATGRLNLWEGAIRSGKTIGSIIRWLELLQTMPRNAGHHFAIGKTERTLRRNVISVVQELVGPGNVRNLSESKGGGVSICGIPVLLAGANDLRAEEKIRGLTGASCYGDEATLWPQSVFQTAIGRLSVPGATFLGTTNPDGPYHWLKTNYIDRADELGLKLFHFDIDDNPFLDPAYVASIKREYVGLWHRRFIKGEWCAAEGAVYADAWDDDACVFQGYTPQCEWWAAADYGTTNPTTYGLYSRDAAGVVRCWHEYWWDSRAEQRQKSDEQYVEDWFKWLKKAQEDISAEARSAGRQPPNIMPRVLRLDPAAASLRVAMEKRGVRVEKANNDVVDGIRFVAGELSARRFLIHKRCKESIREMGAYKWDPKAQSRGEDAPIKQDDHTQDRHRYAIYSPTFRPTARTSAQVRL